MQSWRRNLTLGLVAGGLAVGGFAAAQGIAQARQNPAVVVRFMLGYFDGAGRFVPTAGRNSTNVDRNAIAMFVFSGPIDMGPPERASLPLTLEEQEQLAALQAEDPNFDPQANGYEPGVIPRAKSKDRAAFYVATGSVTTNSVIIAAPQSGGTLTLAPGQFFQVLRGKAGTRTIQNRLIFNPRYTVSAFNHPREIDYNPQGMEPSTLYEVYLDGGPNAFNPFETVRNLDGEMLSVPFATSFTTTNRYVQDYTRPKIQTTSPTDGTSQVSSDADIELTFSEPMDIASFITPRFQGDDQWTVVARYTQNTVLNGNFAGRNLLLQVRVKPQTGGEVIQLRPLQGFGKGPSEIEVIVRNGVTDLSGNNITRQLQITFKSALNPTADQAGFIEELFTSAAKKDTQFGVSPGYDKPSGDNVLATWNTATGVGMLQGVVNDTPFVAASTAPLTNSVNIFGIAPVQFQNLYTTNDMGSRARTITSFAWRAATYIGLTYPNCSIQMGHANDIVAAQGFPGSATTSTGPSPTFYRDVPVVVVPAVTYNTVGKLSGNYVLGPTFAKNFNFDGTNPVILEGNHGGNGSTNERWQCDINYPLQTNIFANFSTTPPVYGTRTWYFDTRFTYLTPGAEAQSLFYDLGRDDARLLPQQLVPTNQPAGTSVTFVWQGAKADVSTPTSPDLATLTPWVADVRTLSLYRHIRFRVTLVNNVTSKTAPSVDAITVPYTYK